ncbi:MAG: L-threonylcarbamoyladenylate synthase [Flavobacteriales bacterium]|jgi:tRNA threonylcarbamoyl adenosine modification protein (Sua5/YciO/YrdC/YwlC family)|tara:strand:+ start:1174 stop:1791 length:618 start_codon:yes stop_codon:yes gene_type:complete
MLLQIHPDNPDPRKIKQVIECLNDGGVIVYPTDTVYSFGCSLQKHKAFERIARLKGLKPEKAHFSLVCYDLSHLSEFSKAVDNRTYKMMRKAFPGPYTFILNASANVPKIFKAKKKTIGIRIPDNNIARTLVNELGSPLIASSVHDEDEIIEYTTDPELIHEKYEKLVDIVIDGGYGNNEASTIYDCTGLDPELIREGIGDIDVF